MHNHPDPVCNATVQALNPLLRHEQGSDRSDRKAVRFKSNIRFKEHDPAFLAPSRAPSPSGYRINLGTPMSWSGLNPGIDTVLADPV